MGDEGEVDPSAAEQADDEADHEREAGAVEGEVILPQRDERGVIEHGADEFGWRMGSFARNTDALRGGQSFLFY